MEKHEVDMAANVRRGVKLRHQSVGMSTSATKVSKPLGIRSRLRQSSLRSEGKSNTSQLNPGGRKRAKLEAGEESESDDEDGGIKVNVKHCSEAFWNRMTQKKNRPYKMDHVPRGYALIVNNTKFKKSQRRNGGDVDLNNITDLFKGLSFETEELKNITAQEMKQKILAFSKRKEHRQMDCCVVVLMSHGNRYVISGTDKKPVGLEDIFAMFDNKRCPQLMGKPKLFFIQACRGDKVDKGVAVPEDEADSDLKSEMWNMLKTPVAEEVESDGPETTPTMTDMLFGYATQIGHKAFRSNKSGSWFIEAITKVFMDQAKNKNLLDMMTAVTKEVSTRTATSLSSPDICGGKEVAEFVSSLQKSLYFFPGAPFQKKPASGASSSKSSTKRRPSPQPSCSNTKERSGKRPFKPQRQYPTDTSNSSDEDVHVLSPKIQKTGKTAGNYTDVRKCVNMVSKNVRQSWDDLADQLGFDHNEIDEIRDLRGDHRRRCIEVLNRWIDRWGDDATVEVLSEALVQIGKKAVADVLKEC